MYITFFRIDNKFVCSSTYFVIFSRKGQGLASSERATHRQSIAGAGGTHYGVQVTNCQPPQAEAWGYRHGASYGALPLAKPLAEPLPETLSAHPDHLPHSIRASSGAGSTHYGVQVADCQPPQAEAWGYQHGASYGALPLAKPLPRVLSAHPDHLPRVLHPLAEFLPRGAHSFAERFYEPY